MTMSYKYIFTLIYMKRMYLIPLMWNNITTIKTTKGEDGIAVNFGMPVVISNLTNDWCKINSIFNAPIGYIPIQDIEIIK